jgi:hypothetical protein
MTSAGKKLALATALLLLMVSLGSRHSTVLAQEIDDPVKIEIYKRFTDNRVPNPAVAYQAAREYVTKYSKDNDQYTAYLNKWITAYEQDDRRRSLPTLINQKKFAEAYGAGAKILAYAPGDLRTQIDLGYAGYLAASANTQEFNSTAINYARTAIQAIESGKQPAEWAPFESKDDTLAYLNYALGFLMLKSPDMTSTPTSADQAIESLTKAVHYESAIKKTASTYYFLAAAYETGPYKSLAASYQQEFANKPETAASKAALDRLSKFIDVIIDAYARAIAAAGTDPKTEQSRKEWLAQVSNYYKFRHDGSEVGLNEFIAGVLQKPLPARP